MLCERTGTLLGNPQLYETSEDVKKEELEDLRPVFEDMFDCIKGIRRDYGFGRAIAAPQIGIKKRLICILTDKPYVIINPTLEFKMLFVGGAAIKYSTNAIYSRTL